MAQNTVWLTVKRNLLKEKVIVKGLPGGNEHEFPPSPNPADPINFTGGDNVKFSLKHASSSTNSAQICFWTDGDLEIEKKKNQEIWIFKVNFPAGPITPYDTTNVEVGVDPPPRDQKQKQKPKGK
jgi:hypothetical protein